MRYEETKFGYKVDLIEGVHLPNNWVDDIKSVIDKYSKEVFMDGTHETSREPKDSDGCKYYVVTGEIIKRENSWIFDLYSNLIKDVVNKIFDEKYVCSSDELFAINYNYLEGIGERYEWHVDSEPLTAILFATSLDGGDGGELAFKCSDCLIKVVPKSGLLLIFKGVNLPHAVLPMKCGKGRISIPMDFYPDGYEESRPSDLAEYIYKK